MKPWQKRIKKVVQINSGTKNGFPKEEIRFYVAFFDKK